ncbi:MAG: hypothetical protein UX87_C0025G0002 [Candidatus Amesbacteria bacterium GW2011_GWA1_47_16]|uniref:Uncharacterized protein n=3 Tax=Candidatus Amesiibacteriota TaxID=1752730 RepID=A0A0G1UBF3_9BACT|nr:MAG: hypothetical protein UX87_C0025G0002 [Candidatus Amesbacteria bacterium GW2011_GWA1_47_16]KKU63458.1 MAG: hypothetical protein UX86_C0024G0006 [Candidatus Amesbacteria bacterium GW2011_GWC1_47_15]KKU95766.1 MAG: hypothetical protein UY28_C0044G0009 [Candidatus Amesbacteria bacterium GW2011_GWB1_48_13]
MNRFELVGAPGSEKFAPPLIFVYFDMLLFGYAGKVFRLEKK